MCELTEVNYLDGEIVWVKLGPCWWPGEVWGNERLPEDVLQGLKKTPIAVVKFFQEESFEYVKNVSNIYKYNCSKKEEFIKKGLDKFRAKNSFMEKFPADIKKAEELTGGNVNIIDDPKYAPSPKPNYNDICGTPVQKKKKSSLKATNTTPSTSKLKSSPIRKGKSASMSPYSPLKTPKSYISGNGSSQYNTPDESYSPIAKYNCYLCDYKSNRINVIVLHLKQHSAGLISSSLSSPNRSRFNNSFNTSRNTIANFSPARASGSSKLTSVKDDLKLIHKSELTAKKGIDKSIKGKMSPGVTPKGKKRGRPKKTEIEDTAKKVKTDHEIKSKLLADWSDDQDSDVESKSTSAENIDKIEDSSDKELVEDVNNIKACNDLESRTSSVEKSEDEMKSKSCFDFEEDDVIDVPKSPGRKIPRLITKKTKKEFEYTPEPADSKCEESQQVDEFIKSPITNTSETEMVAETNQVENSKDFEIDLNDLLNITKPPELPEIPKDKCEKDGGLQSKPLREIMSPKERGKRIFKSKQIFKTRMQEKYGSELKFADVSDGMLDGDSSVKADLIALVEKSVCQQGSHENDNLCKDNGNETLFENETVSIEVLKIISETDPAENSETSNHDDELKTYGEGSEGNDDLSKHELSLYNITNESLKSNNNKLDDDIFTESSPGMRRKSRHSIGEATAEILPTKSTQDINAAVLPLSETLVPEELASDITVPDSLASDIPPQNRSTPDIITDIPSIPEPDISTPDKPISDTSDHDMVASDTLSLDALTTDTPVQVTPIPDLPSADISIPHLSDKDESISDIKVDHLILSKNTSPEAKKSRKMSTSLNQTPSPKRKKNISNLNDAECLISFSESLFTEKKKDKSETKTRNKRTSPRKSIDFSVDSSEEKVTLNIGLGSLDNTEPLESKEVNEAATDVEHMVIKETEPIKSVKKESTEKIENNMDNETIDVPDIQSYITGKSQPERELKMPSSSRLHNILTESTTSTSIETDARKKSQTSNRTLLETADKDPNPKPTKQFVIKMKNEKMEKLNKDIIKSAIDQIEDIEAFVIEKPKPTTNPEVVTPAKTEVKIMKRTASRKPAIISSPKQTLITKTKALVQEDAIFDINSMPIVLSDELITAENIDQVSMALSKNSCDTSLIIDNNLIIMDQKQDIPMNKIEHKLNTAKTTKMQILKKVEKPNALNLQLQKATTTTTSANTILAKNQRLYQSPTKTKLLKSSPTVITQPGKPGKFIVIPSSTPPTGSKYTVGKRLQQKTMAMKIPSNITNDINSQQLKIGNKSANSTSKPIVQKVVHQKVNIDSSGNTVLFITNSNGEQSKVVLTPDQKIKSSLTPQTIVTSKGAIINPRQASPTVTTSKSNQLILTSKGHIISRTALQTTSKLSPVTIKQKSSQMGQTLLTPKGSLINTGQFLTSSSQIVPSNQQLVMNKGNVLTPLTANQMKKIRNQNASQKIIINKKQNVIMQQSGINKEKTITSKVVQNTATEKPKAPVQKKGFVKLSAQQLADMEKLGYVEETEHGKIITPEGIRYMQAMSKEKGIKIQTVPHRKIKPNATIKKITTVPSSIDHVTTVTPKRTMILNKQQALPPLTPIGDSKATNQQELIYQKVSDIQVQSTAESELAVADQAQTEQLMNAAIPSSQEEAIPPVDISVTELGAQTNSEHTLSAIPDAQLLAVPGETFGGPAGSFFLCSVEDNGNLTPIDNQPLYLDANNQLVPATGIQDAILNSGSEETAATDEISASAPETDQAVAPTQLELSSENLENQQIIINADGQQFILDQQSLLALTEQQILTTDGQQLILQGNAQEILAALTANQEVNMLDEASLAVASNVTYQHEFGNKDILATALANTNVFQNEGTNSDLEIYQNLQTDYKHSSVSETSTALSQPIMSPLELPSKKPDENEKIEGMSFNQNIDDSLAVIGVNSTNVPTSLDLPITITNPKIAPKSTNPLNMACEMIYQSSSYSPVTSKELATGDIFQPQDITINDQTILHSSDVATTLSMPDLSGMDSDVTLNTMDSSETNFPTESMPLLNDDSDIPSKDVSSIEPLTSKPGANTCVAYSENLPTEIVAPPSTTPDIEEPNKAEEPVLDTNEQNIEQDVSSVNAENETHFQSQELGMVKKDESSLCVNNTELKPESSVTDKINVPMTCTENSLDTNENSQNALLSQSGKDTELNKTYQTESSRNEDSESIRSLQVNEKEDILNKNTTKNSQTSDNRSSPIKNGKNDNGFSVTESERERSDSRQEVTTPITSEINIITENLNFGSEASDLLTPDTIPETIISPRSPNNETQQDFCESSNSCEIPIQPNLIFDQESTRKESITNNRSDSDSQVMENEKENDSKKIKTNDNDPSPSLFDFDSR